MTQDKRITTTGIGSFGESGEIDNETPLFQVVAGHPMDYALEQSTHLITCAYTLSDIALTQDLKNAPTLLAAAHYLTGMAKALSQDVSHAVTNSPAV
ncbi:MULTISPECIES: DUF3077 domain-containing protein [Pseudomonas]|jgi:hypothetical protein|uniref:DUF3077 domain-containing protein n=1 Tax=Pseudomonas soli TaxID=1306993 RepID=A0A2V4IFN1_9PSED|nr:MULTISPECIES: DUF3077 domain-containing protein [Pseudomonas]PYB85282.1 hypothetical protein DMX07_04620 [Pseudomonas soli]PZW86818.1 hypothetical protein DFS21_101584 [Pseudomonas sp. 2848]